MVEKKYGYMVTDEKVIEKIIEDNNVGINHMILRKGEALPQHYSNSNVYMVVVRGTVSLEIDDEKENSYPKGSMLTIPYKTKMDVSNREDETLELFVIKAPSPRVMKD